jgi:clan AA aspartic protease
MGNVRADIQLVNPIRRDLQPLQVSALVDTGMLLCIPKHDALQLDLNLAADEREITLADGSQQKVPYVGPIEVSFENRRCFVGALVLENDVLLGAVPMEDMDLVVLPAKQQLAVNPDNPNIAHALVK